MIPVPKDLDKQPFITFLSNLEKLMGEDKFGIWLSKEHPELNTLEVQKKHAIENEVVNKEEFEFKLADLHALEARKEYEKEKVALLDQLRQYQHLIQEFVAQLNQSEMDRAASLKKLLEMERLIKDQLNMLIEKIFEQLKRIDAKIQFLSSVLERINTLIEAVTQKLNTEITKLISNYEKFINNLPETNQEIKNIKLQLLQSLPSTNSAINNRNSLDVFSNLFHEAIRQIAEIDPKFNVGRATSAINHISSLERNVADLTLQSDKLIATRNNVKEEIESLKQEATEIQEVSYNLTNKTNVSLSEPIQSIEFLNESAEYCESASEFLINEPISEIREDDLKLLEEMESEFGMGDDMPEQDDHDNDQRLGL
ncbi:MAG: hypothetical protein P4M14_05835 [Gammaproteobacteria bacterium]|nr:hypothetical protein [Gammaproteobacteria bacterium]